MILPYTGIQSEYDNYMPTSTMLVPRVQVLTICQQDGFIRRRLSHLLSKLSRVQEFRIAWLHKHRRSFNKDSSFQILNAPGDSGLTAFDFLNSCFDDDKLLFTSLGEKTSVTDAKRT